MKKIMINSFGFDALDDTTRILLVPSGSFTGVDGRHYVNSNPEFIIEQFKMYGRSIPIDVEHSTQRRGAQGLSAPAVGWINDLFLEAGNVYGVAEFTDKGKELIEEKAYRYYSPAFYVSEDGVVGRLVSVGLTNVPNLELPALNREEEEEKGENMESIRKALGLAAEATEEQIVAKITEIQTNSATYEARVSELEQQRVKLEANSTLDAAIADGKLAPSQKETFLLMINSQEDLNSVKASISKMAKIIPGGTVVTGDVPESDVQLNSEQQKIVNMFGFTEEEIKKVKEELR